MVKFSKDIQPTKRRSAEIKKVTMTASVKPSTKAFFQARRGECGEVLDRFVENYMETNPIEYAKSILLSMEGKERQKAIWLTCFSCCIRYSDLKNAKLVGDYVECARPMTIPLYKAKATEHIATEYLGTDIESMMRGFAFPGPRRMWSKIATKVSGDKRLIKEVLNGVPIKYSQEDFDELLTEVCKSVFPENR